MLRQAPLLASAIGFPDYRTAAPRLPYTATLGVFRERSGAAVQLGDQRAWRRAAWTGSLGSRCGMKRITVEIAPPVDSVLIVIKTQWP